MAATNHHAPGLFAITKFRALVAISLLLTWWFASLLPHYRPMIEASISSRIEEARQKVPKIKVDWHPVKDPRAAYNQSKVALMIEPRPLPQLVPQILHMITVVPRDWRFVFIGSRKSVVSMERAFAVKHQQVIGKLDLLVLPEPWEIDSKEKVHRMLTDMRFYDEFLPRAEWILKYESDSILCANSERSLDDWLEWSWAGAPRSPEDRFSGNGGLSLRKMSAIRKVLRFQERYNDTDPEDEWFGKRLWVLPGEKVASGLDGVLAVEDVYIDQPMGYHIREGGSNLPDGVWKDPDQRKKIFDYCPELSLIMDMKLERERCPGDDKGGVIHPTEEELAVQRIQQEQELAAQNLRLEEEARQRAEEEKKAAAEESSRSAASAAAASTSTTEAAAAAATDSLATPLAGDMTTTSDAVAAATAAATDPLVMTIAADVTPTEGLLMATPTSIPTEGALQGLD